MGQYKPEGNVQIPEETNNQCSTIHFWWAMWRQSRGESEWPALQQTQLKKEDWKHTWCFEKAEGITLCRDKIQKGVEVFLCVLWATQEVMGQRCSMEIY